MEVKNITFREYIELDDEKRSEYNFLIKYANDFKRSEDCFNLGDPFKWKFGIVKDLQTVLGRRESNITELFDYITLISNADKKELAKSKLSEITKTISYIVDSIETISEIEKVKLSHEPDPIEQRAGLEAFQIIGVYIQVRDLTNGDVTKNDLVRNTLYEDCFLELYSRSELAQYNRRLSELRNKQK